MKNRGMITIEACFVVPLFLFFMLSVAGIYMVLLADAHIHQSLAEAAGEVAQYAYLEDCYRKQSKSSVQNLVNMAMLNQKFRNYLGEDLFVEKVVKSGKNGIVVTAKQDQKNAKIFVAKARYLICVQVPFLGKKVFYRENEMKQKNFVGYSKEESSGYGDENTYVYVTPEQSVYHTKRSCTHLELTIHSESAHNKSHYVPCHFCARKRGSGNEIYVSKTNNIYHCNRACSGLKRTIMRVKKTEIGGLNVCSRCGK
ncbi:MAG: pilus assembly protein [Eubacteriales bacterium]|nr:pilus assembly protein [Eubacteriales bacterium]